MALYDYAKERGAGGGGSVIRLGLALFIAFLAVVLLWASLAQVPAGHVGVLTLFGEVVTGKVLPEGIHLVNPFAVNHVVSVRTQELKETASVPSSEGLVVNLDTSLIFHLQPEKAAEVYQKIGPGYIDVIVEPTLRSSIRSITSAHSANALYSSGREEVAKQIREQLQTELAPRGVVVENVLLRDIQLPPTLKASIE
ncbi:MAG: prohibitin family protein, partial [Burkholderiales bacterium]